jgi:Di-haem oxidoreductase, putative peroxidase
VTTFGRSACLIALAVLFVSAKTDNPDAPTVQRYFGEPLPKLNRLETSAFERGARFFAMGWGDFADGVANAPSCTSCHSVPTPGGSGMSERALVAVDSSALPGTRGEVVQRTTPSHSDGEVRRTPALFGIGYLERILPTENAGPFRFGAHSKQSSLFTFVSIAFANELGISTPSHCSRKSIDSKYPTNCKARVSQQQINDIVTYIRLFAPPARPSRPNPIAISNMNNSGCNDCHLSKLAVNRVSQNGKLVQYVYPYSDLRTHDIKTSSRGAIRTTPLWGLNSYGPPYLHNGTADSIEDAILSHHGDAEYSRTRFLGLKPSERAGLLDYLRSF